MVVDEVERALSLPEADAIECLAKIPESQWFERKSGRIEPAKLAIALVAMANAEGGTVVVGIENKAPYPISPKDLNALRQTAISYTHPPVRAKIQDLKTEFGTVMVFQVSPSDYVHETNKAECYLRVGDSSKKLDFRQRQELTWDRSVACFDGTPAQNPTIEGLDLDRVKRFQEVLGTSDINKTMAARDLFTSDGKVTVAGHLLFANRPQIDYPSAYVRILCYRENDRGAGRYQSLADGGDVRCEGPITDQIEQAVKAIEELIPKRRALTDGNTFQPVPIIPKDAWLEGLVNAVVHRSYSNSGDHIRVDIFPNRIEIASPGRFPGLVDLSKPDEILRNSRNPRIARVCSDLGYTQELGEGIRRISEEMRRVGLNAPIYKQTSSSVILTLLSSAALPPEVLKQIGKSGETILDSMRSVQGPLGTGQLVELTGLARPTVLRQLKKLRELGLVSWDGRGPSDPRASWQLV